MSRWDSEITHSSDPLRIDLDRIENADLAQHVVMPLDRRGRRDHIAAMLIACARRIMSEPLPPPALARPRCGPPR